LGGNFLAVLWFYWCQRCCSSSAMSSSERDSSDSEGFDEETTEVLNKPRPSRSKAMPARLSDSACIHQ